MCCYLFLSIYAPAATQDDSWQNLRHLTRERYYTILDRKSNCVTGHIAAATDHVITLELTDGTSATFERANVLRVSVSQAAPYLPSRVQADIASVRDIVYNDKSSWRDLKGLAAQEETGILGQSVTIVKSDGGEYEGRVLAISDAQLELDRPDGKLAIAKANVAQVYYLRYKPLTDSEKYSAQEDFWIDPRLWPYYLHLAPKVPVRLYDSSQVEDDSPVACQNAPKEKPAWDFCFSGYVQSIDPSRLTLRRVGRDAQTVQLSKNTSVRVRTRQSAVEDIKVGDEIIACGFVENGDFVAERINLSK
jgi:preprotein translocase subunit YajC